LKEEIDACMRALDGSSIKQAPQERISQL